MSTTVTRELRQIASDLVQYVPPEHADDFQRFLLSGDYPHQSSVTAPRDRATTVLARPASSAPRLMARGRQPIAVPVARLNRDVVVKIASTREEWEQAFTLVASNYRAKGYEGSMSCKVRFTPFHALPDTATFIAMAEDRLLMTMTIVPDNTLLGLPLECLYAEEVNQLRRQRRRLGEVISLSADSDLEMREFRRVFIALVRLMMQYHVTLGGDTWVITVNPKHSDYYTKALGFTKLGPRRTYPEVEGHPAEAFMADQATIASNAPRNHQEIFGEWLPGEAFLAPRIPPHMIRYLTQTTTDRYQQSVKQARPDVFADEREVFDFDQFFSCPRRW